MSAKYGCLIIHGFAGGVQDVAPLADFLTGAGHEVVCSRLPGHTGMSSDLGNAGYRDWIDSPERDLLDLRAKCDRVALVGFSMGGLIAVNLAVRHDVESAILLNTPIHYWNAKRMAVNIIHDLKTCDLANIRRYCRGTVNHPPLRALLNFLLILRQTKALLPKVTCPVLVGQALKDDVVQPGSADVIFDSVSSKRKVIRLYTNSEHLLFHSPDKDNAIADVAEFIAA